MAEHTITVDSPSFEVLNRDLVVEVRSDEVRFGRLTISRGGIGWYPASGQLERHFSWEQFDRMIQNTTG